MRLFLLCTLLYLSGNSWAQTYQVGQTYFDTNQYIEYQPGNIPLIIIVPHGGYLEPASIPDRNCTGCSYIRDAYTQELGRILAQVVADNISLTGVCRPHLIINRLHRKKLDANRALITAADGAPQAEAAWYVFHNFIEAARDTSLHYHSRALVIDLHGHGHTIQRLELGYLLSSSTLRQADSLLDSLTNSSISGFIPTQPNTTLSNFIRGNTSLAAEIEQNSTLTAVPSPSTPAPLVGEPYFQGGYNTQRYGSRNGGNLDAIQIECHQGMRFDSTIRTNRGWDLGVALFRYLETNYAFSRTNNPPVGQHANCFTIVNTTKIKQDWSPLLYPNPSHDYVQVTHNNYPLEVYLYNNMGQLLHQQTLENGQERLSLRKVPTGSYYLKIEDPIGQQYTQLLIKSTL